MSLDIVQVVGLNPLPVGIVGHEPIIGPILILRQTDKIAQPLLHAGTIGRIGIDIDARIGPAGFANHHLSSAIRDITQEGCDSIQHVGGRLINGGHGRFPKGKMIEVYDLSVHRHELGILLVCLQQIGNGHGDFSQAIGVQIGPNVIAQRNRLVDGQVAPRNGLTRHVKAHHVGDIARLNQIQQGRLFFGKMGPIGTDPKAQPQAQSHLLRGLQHNVTGLAIRQGKDANIVGDSGELGQVGRGVRQGFATIVVRFPIGSNP